MYELIYSPGNNLGIGIKEERRCCTEDELEEIIQLAEQQELVDAGVLKDKIKTFIEGAKKMKEKSTNMEEDNYYRGKIDGIRLVERWLNLQNKSQHST